MPSTNASFQVFAKPAGARCNLACAYCYYLAKEELLSGAAAGGGGVSRMAPEVLEAYVAQHIAACSDREIRFSWHGGEPTLLGIDFFREVVALQRRLRPPGRAIVNGIQTNGTRLDQDWGRFLAAERFAVGISIDGPAALHDRHRVTRGGAPTHARVMEGYRLLQAHRVDTEVLCVVSRANGARPLDVYRFLRDIGARYITFLPLVQPLAEALGAVTPDTVPSEVWGEFLCTVFDAWKTDDIGTIKVQLFEETLGTAFGHDHALCVLRPTCGDVPVVECNGDFYACDHCVDAAHRMGNILDTPLAALLASPAQRSFGRAKLDTLPPCCLACAVRYMCNGGCPKDRFALTADGEPGLNYLCAGYRRFFHHVQPLVQEIAALHRETSASAARALRDSPPALARPPVRPGRNDPCPCGSGRKYKHCCLRR